MPGVAPTCSSGHRLIQRSFPTDAPTPSRPTSNQHRFVQSSNPGCWNGNHEGRKGFPAVATGVESSGLIEPCPSVRERPALARRCAPKPVTPTFRIPTSRRRRHAPHPSFRRKPESTSPPPTATPSKVRTATKPVPKITQIKRITVQDQAPPTSHQTTTPPVFPAKPGTHAPSPPSVYPRVAVDATPPTRLSGESRNLRHPQPQPPSKVRTATKPVPKITQIKRITVQDQAPPPVFPAKPGTHAPSPPSVYPRVAVDATPPTRLSGESRNLRHPPTATPSKVRTATKPVPKITQIKRITVQEQAPPHPPPHNHPHPSLL